RRVIEGGHADARIVRGGDECVTGTEARTGYAQSAVALLLEPIEAATDIHHTLASCIQRASDIGRDCIIRAPDFRRHADVMIWHAQPQNRDSQPIQHAAETCVCDRIGVPMWY